ncbi:family 16 glycosylhydrolase [Micromonospora sp. PLK6-60]|uniref:glycoside hydrolase family 16 protein n=1 Tax=Micromonospora sp. PLK6-60 TaxID=2873383 RepID=UPI001CA5FD37|nr:glycoside hydrolase family 16 protein [Micromonospora sp. PLK6-60]MBY8874204.1 family 16 glycosylhydrolase [Micromonospora sp. PLK6-60]
MRSIRTIATVALAAVGLSIALTATTSAPAVAGPGAVTWSDEFNGAAGTPPDPAKWRYDTGGGGWGNNELQYYTTSTRNAALDGNGNLVITARKENPGGYNCWYGSCQYTSARLLTSGTFAQAYGRFEARIKIPRGQGLWPAFWMLGNDIGSNPWPNSGEIDIMENVGSAPSTVWGTLHGPGYSGGNGLSGSTSLPGGQALADAFHTFTVDWAPDAITWYLDGVAYSRKTPADAGGNRWVFDHPFFMIMNVAVGGNWPGSPNASTTFPQTMVVDYVRVQAWDTGSGGTGAPIVGYGNKCVDVASANTANGTPVQLWTCNGTAAQKWTWAADGSVRALGKCLDVTAASTANGAKVQLYDCNGTGAQRWVFSSAGDIVNPQSNKCLDATGASSADGTRLQIWECTGGANQKWRR